MDQPTAASLLRPESSRPGLHRGPIFVPEARVLRQLAGALQLTLVVNPNTTLVRYILGNPTPTIVRIRIPLWVEGRWRPCCFGPWPDHRLGTRYCRLGLASRHQTFRWTDRFRQLRRFQEVEKPSHLEQWTEMGSPARLVGEPLNLETLYFFGGAVISCSRVAAITDGSMYCTR
jgi:hypothetical protein